MRRDQIRKMKRNVARKNIKKQTGWLYMQTYTDKCNALLNLNYSSGTIHYKTNIKERFRLSKDLIGFNGDIVLPSHTCRKKLSQRFNSHSTDKISNIMKTLQAGLSGDNSLVMSTAEGIL